MEPLPADFFLDYRLGGDVVVPQVVPQHLLRASQIRPHRWCQDGVPGRWSEKTAWPMVFSWGTHLSFLCHGVLSQQYLIECMYCSSGWVGLFRTDDHMDDYMLGVPSSWATIPSIGKARANILKNISTNTGIVIKKYAPTGKENDINSFMCQKCSDSIDYCRHSTISSFSSSISGSGSGSAGSGSAGSGSGSGSGKFPPTLKCPPEEFLFVDAVGSWKGSGLGHVLIKKFISETDKPIVLHPASDNPKLVGYYESLGFIKFTWPDEISKRGTVASGATKGAPKVKVVRPLPSHIMPDTSDGLPSALLFFSICSWSDLVKRGDTEGLMIFIQ